MLCRATPDRRVVVESSDKMWSTEEENGKPLQYSFLENPMNNMKRLKHRTLKDELPRWVGTQYATGDQWRINARKNEVQFISVQFSHSVVSNSLQPHELQHLRNQWKKWTGIGKFNSDDHSIYYCGQKSLRRNGVAVMVNKKVWNAVLGCNLKNNRMISVCFRGKPFNITAIQVYALTSNAEEAEVERFYEDLQDLLELIPKKDVLSIIGDWNTKVGIREIPAITGKSGLGVQNEAGQKLTEFCQRMHWSLQTPSYNNTREDSTHGHQ